MKLRAILILISSSLIMLGGCATSRSVIDVPPPNAQAAEQKTDKEVFVASVTDRRSFKIAPDSPSIPSLDPDESQDDKIKARAVGRKRNTWGKALGDILLKEDQTVEMLMTNAIRQAFAEQGYRLVERKEDATQDTLLVKANVDKFWSWMNPGFAALTLSTEISTRLALESPNGKANKNVYIKSSGEYQTGMEENWIEVINMALRAYIDELKGKLE